MEIIYRIVGLGVLMSVLYAGASVYDTLNKAGGERVDKGRMIINILFNMVKVIIAFSLVCTGVMFLFLKPIIGLIS